MMLLAQAAETGIDLAKILSIGGPSSIATGLVMYLGKLWLDSRKEKREDTKTEREGESQIVATTDALAKLVREQMVAMGAENKMLQVQVDQMKLDHRREMDELRAEHRSTLEKLNERIRGLELDNDQLRRDRYGG